MVGILVITLNKIVLNSKYRVQFDSQLGQTLNNALIGASVFRDMRVFIQAFVAFFFCGWHFCVGKVDLFSSVFCFATLEILKKSLPKYRRKAKRGVCVFS